MALPFGSLLGLGSAGWAFLLVGAVELVAALAFKRHRAGLLIGGLVVVLVGGALMLAGY